MYHFDQLPTRRGTGCVKWDGDGVGPDVLPLWVADMDFPVLPAVQQAVVRRAQHPVYGYPAVPPAFYDAICRWLEERHGLHAEPEGIIYTIGVVPALSAAIKALTHAGHAVLTLTPVYTHFFSSIRNNGCRIVEAPLRLTGRRYEIDFPLVERLIREESVRVLLLCNPQNPGGRCWTPDELRQLADICRRHGVRIISDEIHCEIVLPGFHYTPMASIEPATVTLLSPTKGFNFAGLQIAYILSPDAESHRLIDRAINDNEVCDVNLFGIEALIAAYGKEGAEWLAEMCRYVAGNLRCLEDFLAQHLPEANVLEQEGTYLAWVRLPHLAEPVADYCERLRRERKVFFSPGTLYGAAGEGFLRINLATSRAILTEALGRWLG